MEFLFALILIIGLILLAFWWINRDNPGFDERQVAVQRKAYQIGFFIETIYMLGLFIYGTMAPQLAVDWTLLVMLGIILPSIPVITCMIWKDAYFKPGQSYLGFGIAGTLTGAMNLYSAVILYRSAPAGEDAKTAVPFLSGFFWLWIGGLMIVKHFVNKRIEKEV